MFLPNIIWPRELRDTGPAFDPSIVLRGEAKNGAASNAVIAVRTHEYRTGPDFRDDINECGYDREVGEILEVLDSLVEQVDLALLPLTSGRYFLWMVPANDE
jgi:hypothetical protein